MRILIIDDQALRHESLYKNIEIEFEGSVQVHVWNQAQAVAEIKLGKFDFIFLDCDLGSGGSGYNTMVEMIRYVPQDNWPNRVVIHSRNPVEAKAVELLLTNQDITAYQRPFYTE